MTKDYDTIGVPIGTRLLRIVRLLDGWCLWTGTRDFEHGSYIKLNNDGSVHNVTIRVNEVDEVHLVRPADKDIV